MLRALVCVAGQLLPDVQHTCLCSFTCGPSVAECNRRAKLGCIEVLAMLRERVDSLQVCACQLSFLSMALILAHIPTYRSQINIQTNACTFCTGTVFVWAASVTYQLCHMYVRADKMVRYASPAYLADHLRHMSSARTKQTSAVRHRCSPPHSPSTGFPGECHDG